MNLVFAPTLPDAFERAGLPFPEREPEPGRLCRFPTNGRKDDAAGWLRVFPDAEGAVFGSWRDGTAWTWQRAKDGPAPDAAELARIRANAERIRKEAEAEREEGYRQAASKAAATVQAAEQAQGHPYLSTKGIGPHIARERNGSLVIPVFDNDGNVQSVQSVSPTGEKRFMPGGKMQGGRCWLGEPTDAGPLVLCEGYATGASIREATGWPVCVTFTAGNLRPVACDVRERFPRAKLVIAGDDDRKTESNPGRAKALEAAKLVNAITVFPSFDGPEGTDFNDMAQQAGREAVARLIRDTVEPRRFKLAERTAARLFKGEPPPVNWLVTGIFPLGVTCLLASPPNVGKSFLALELAAKVAGRRDGECPPVAFGALVAAHGRAVYVSAEDDEPEIHRRLHALCGSAMPDRLHVLSLPDVGHFGIIEPDPVTKEFRATREWSELADEIRALPDVRLVILDTLQALTSGDTNTSQATQPLMNEATALARATGACVMLIHHVAKGSTKEIRSALDAMEAIRGSGAIAGSARAAYVLWPPADGGRNVCEVLGNEFKEGRVAFGLVAKAYGDARRDRSVFVRNERGILTDRTQAYNALSGGDTDAMRNDLLRAIREAWQRGEAFAASQGSNGLHSRRFELPESFHEKPRQWFEEQAGKLLSEGNIKRLSYRGGARLVPADAETAMPTPPEGATPEAENVAPEVTE
ncbi:AAA family ATPase [Aromatoleum buckelii]|uniref:AAA family ATPase n=1 Tax=Aromatoleum buckelii TaxID=200254 RepID=A0ABX1N3B0_9RHOO|nr:AAA family ATPase [Aromatoleum buckelii]MCK0510794.1 AAA family ATPase [Aromatoleum buckelii]